MDRHIILTSGRAGSNFLISTLNLHPQVLNFGEVLGDWTLPYKVFSKTGRALVSHEAYVEMIFGSRSFYYAAQAYSLGDRLRSRRDTNFKRRSNLRTIGIKDMFINIRLRDLESWLNQRSDVKLIWLRRVNLLRRYLSWVFVRRSGVIKTEKSVFDGKLQVDLDDMMVRLDTYTREAEEERTFLEGLPNHPQLHIVYEDLFASPEATERTLQDTFEFLGVDPIEAKSKHKKILPKPFDGLVANLDELRKRLSDTPYLHYLEETPEQTEPRPPKRINNRPERRAQT